MKYIRKYETEYQDSKERCEKQLNATDSEIIAAIEAEDNELKKKFGGRDCLTIISGIDNKTGKPIEEPKPPHCKNSPTTQN